MSIDSDAILRANLAILSKTRPELAQRLQDADPAELTWDTARTGEPTASLQVADSERPIALVSKYDPAGEAEKLLAKLDFAKTACVVLLGFGLGHAARQASEKLGNTGLLIVYEPDTAVLAAVFRRLDLTALLHQPNLLLLGEGDDRATLTRLTERYSAMLTQGTQIVTLPAGRSRQAEAYKQFSQLIADHVAYCRTNVATALVNASRTCRNLAANLADYAAGATTEPLKDAAKGRVAVCVGAGPSLVKNVHFLQDPKFRGNVVVIAVQTALKPLLDRGIQPDFVTALDYSPICARFYEGLPHLPRVTLVAEPKANAAIFEAYPGPIRVTQSSFNDQLLGHPDQGGLARPITPIKGGATVAHLSFYLAQHLGCDPILFIGQDLGFSDGLYYAPGTAVHQVWDCELNAFNTIEMMEWRRVVRMRGNLKKFDDVHGRPIYSDEQMITYLRQFERDFAEAEAQGQRINDCTEGGMVKEHTQRMTLAEALEQYATQPVPALPIPAMGLDAERLKKLNTLMADRLADIRELRAMSEDSHKIVRRMIERIDDQPELSKLFTKLEKNRMRVEGDLKQAFAVVNQLNTIGAFKRGRADRGIAFQQNDAQEKLLAQLHRDRDNIDWIIQACDEALEILRESHQRIQVKLNDADRPTVEPMASGLAAA